MPRVWARALASAPPDGGGVRCALSGDGDGLADHGVRLQPDVRALARLHVALAAFEADARAAGLGGLCVAGPPRSGAAAGPRGGHAHAAARSNCAARDGDVGAPVPAALRLLAERAACDTLPPPSPSALHLQVATALRAELRLSFDLEALIRPLGFRVDVLLCDAAVALEVNGPTHDAPANAPVRRLRARLLRAAGYALVDVPYTEWDALNGRRAQGAYLAAKLAPHCPPALGLSPATIANPRGLF